LYGAIVGGSEAALVIDVQRGAGVLAEPAGQRDADGIVLRDAFGREAVSLGVGDLGRTQRVVQFEGGDADFFQRGEPDARVCDQG
jgi:hypothetical protein